MRATDTEGHIFFVFRLSFHGKSYAVFWTNLARHVRHVALPPIFNRDTQASTFTAERSAVVSALQYR
jgi:hypothetical protein